MRLSVSVAAVFHAIGELTKMSPLPPPGVVPVAMMQVGSSVEGSVGGRGQRGVDRDVRRIEQPRASLAAVDGPAKYRPSVLTSRQTRRCRIPCRRAPGSSRRTSADLAHSITLPPSPRCFAEASIVVAASTVTVVAVGMAYASSTALGFLTRSIFGLPPPQSPPISTLPPPSRPDASI